MLLGPTTVVRLKGPLAHADDSKADGTADDPPAGCASAPAGQRRSSTGEAFHGTDGPAAGQAWLSATRPGRAIKPGFSVVSGGHWLLGSAGLSRPDHGAVTDPEFLHSLWTTLWIEHARSSTCNDLRVQRPKSAPIEATWHSARRRQTKHQLRTVQHQLTTAQHQLI